MMVYPVVLHQGVRRQCSAHSTRTEFKAYEGDAEHLRLKDHHVRCEHQWPEDFYAIEWTEPIITLGVPLLFTFILARGAEVWEINAGKKVATLQVAVLNLIDLGELMSLPFKARGLYWFQRQPEWW